MRVFAYCCASFEEATRRAAGVEPVLSPPTSADDFDLAWLEDRDFIYFDLHGWPMDGRWYGDNGLPALKASQIRQADLGGAIVFAVSCYLADEDSPMLDALLDAGARYVIGGDGANWAGKSRALLGASLLGLWMRKLLAIGADPLWALTIAKRRLQLELAGADILQQEERAEAARDTLQFRAYYRPKQ